MTRYERDGKHAVSVGDYVHVAANPDSPSGETGWNMAKVLRFIERTDQPPIAVVTAPKNGAGVRHVSADRLTRKQGI